MIPLFMASWAASASASAILPFNSPLIFWSFSTHCFFMVGSLNEPPLLALTMRATVLLARRVDSSTKTWGAAATTGAIVFCQLAAVGLDLCSGGVCSGEARAASGTCAGGLLGSQWKPALEKLACWTGVWLKRANLVPEKTC